MRIPIVAANWKMHKTTSEARAFVEDFVDRVTESTEVEIVLAAPFTALSELRKALATNNTIRLCGQNLYPVEEGAFTGEISPGMLREVGCDYVIVGHSERRRLFNERDAFVAQKLAASLEHQLTPILCVGETLDERKAGNTAEVLKRQLVEALNDISLTNDQELVVAYEPVWAIGTGVTASPKDAQAGAKLIRDQLSEIFDGQLAERARIQYGGSVTPQNAAELLALTDIDGALVGGASLDPDSFFEIVKAAQLVS